MSNTDDDMQGRKLPRGVYPDRDRHGNVRLYFRHGRGRKVRLHAEPGTQEFEDELQLARMGVRLAPEEDDRRKLYRPDHGTLDWLIDGYEKRGAPQLQEPGRSNRMKMLREVADWKKKDKRRGELQFAGMERRHVVEIRDALRDKPEARNAIIKAISALFGWAIEAGEATANPAVGIRKLQSESDGFHTWTIDEVRRYLSLHKPGTMAHRALVVILFTGLRLRDAAIAGRQHLYRDEAGALWFRMRPGKTRKSSGVHVDIPVLPWLEREIETCGNALTFILNDFGRPFTVKGLGNKMRKWCDEAGLHHCSAHGLRKAGATIAAENGADPETMKAIWGWTTLQQVEVYTRAVNRKKAAARAGDYLVLDIAGTKDSHRMQVVEESGSKTGKKANKING